MAAAHVQNLGSAHNETAAQTTTVLSPAAKTVTAGNTIIVGWNGYYNVTPSGVTDNLGNTYSRVERTFNATATADLWYAPVTFAGSITTITVSHASTQYVAVMAAEFSGVGTLAAAGGGLSNAGSTPSTWVNNKTIPANGLAVGWTGSSTGNTQTAGAASGSPSTTIVLSAFNSGGGGQAGSLCYAIASGADVTGFAGTTAFVSMVWAAAGALFNPTSVVPVWTTPADTVPMGFTPELKFTSPISVVLQHFYMQLDTADTFGTGNLRTYDSSTSQTNWTYWDGGAWADLPSDGLPIAESGNEVCYTVTSALSATTWYRRVRAGTLA